MGADVAGVHDGLFSPFVQQYFPIQKSILYFDVIASDRF